MLSHEDERRLAAIERQMHDNDPGFVRRFRRRATKMPTGRMGWLATATMWIVAVVGGLVVVTGLVTGSGPLFLMGATVALAAGCLLQRRRRRR